MGQTRMTISLKVLDKPNLNAERACDILDSLLISLADGYFEGSNYKREYIRLFDFDWGIGDVYDYVKIKFHDPDSDEVKRPRDDFEDGKEYEDYLEEVRQCGYPDLEYNYELKDACTEAEVLKYLSDTLKEVLDNHYPTVLNAFSRDSILELITVLNYGSQVSQTDDLSEFINTYSKYSHEMVNKTAEYHVYEDALFELIKKYHKAKTKEEKDSTFNFITKKLKDLQTMNIEMMAIGLKQGIARKSLKKTIRAELPEINKLMNKYDIK